MSNEPLNKPEQDVSTPEQDAQFLAKLAQEVEEITATGRNALILATEAKSDAHWAAQPIIWRRLQLNLQLLLIVMIGAIVMDGYLICVVAARSERRDTQAMDEIQQLKQQILIMKDHLWTNKPPVNTQQ